MDPITHALSGAVAARAFVPVSQDDGPSRVTRWAVILGSIFPDIDVVGKPFVAHDFSTICFHRSVTHSLVCLPLWAVLFAFGAAWFCRRRGIAAPGRAAIGVAFGAGIALHILFDCITSFGTMAFSPLSWRRIQWDWTFILDLSLTGVLLFFLLLSWVAERAEHRARRAAVMFALMAVLVGGFVVATLGLDQAVAAPAVASALVLSALPLLAAWSGRSLVLTPTAWCRVGVLAAAAYIGMDAWAHSRARDRVREFAAAERLDVVEAGALPLPPNLNLWQGFARTPDATYEWTYSLAHPPDAVMLPSHITRNVAGSCPAELWHVPQVGIWLGFARFPTVVCSQSGGFTVAEFADLRFRRPAIGLRPDDRIQPRPMPFTWRITLNRDGQVLTEGWVTR